MKKSFQKYGCKKNKIKADNHHFLSYDTFYLSKAKLQGLKELLSAYAFNLDKSEFFFQTTSRPEAFEKILGKGENAVYQHYLLFPNCWVSAILSYTLCRRLR